MFDSLLYPYDKRVFEIGAMFLKIYNIPYMVFGAILIGGAVQQ